MLDDSRPTTNRVLGRHDTVMTTCPKTLLDQGSDRLNQSATRARGTKYRRRGAEARDAQRSARPSWVTKNDFDAKPIDVAIAIATGKNPFAIVKWLSGTRRTSEQVQALYVKWSERQPR